MSAETGIRQTGDFGFEDEQIAGAGILRQSGGVEPFAGRGDEQGLAVAPAESGP